MSGRALVLAAHGSRHAPQVNERIRSLAQRITGRAAADDADNQPGAATGYDTVAVAFHQGQPCFADVLDELVEDDVTVVPLMTSRGYYADHVLPRELARSARFSRVKLRITPPVGTHPAMVELALRRVEALCRQQHWTMCQTAIAVVGHGTTRHWRSRRATVNLASQIGYTGCVAHAFAVFLDDAPGLDAVAGYANCENIIVLPFLIGSGPHVLHDIPNRIGLPVNYRFSQQAQQVGRHRLICDQPLGDDEGIGDIVLTLARGNGERSAHPRPRRAPIIGTRASRLARWQTDLVAQQLADTSGEPRIVEVATLGDRMRECPIDELPSDAPFCDELEHALGAGEIDLAVHSLKDLALHPGPAFELAAILPRGDAQEALVSRTRQTLRELPSGARVGTSSARRTAQILALRPDLNVQPIRGPVDDRVRQVHAGDFDAAILALAGLQRLNLADAAAEVFSIDRFTPAPAQGAIAVQVRSGDETALLLARPLDDRKTRIATTLELNILRALEPVTQIAVAAHAVVTDVVHLHVRILALDGSRTWDFTHCGRNPAEAQRGALAQAERQLAALLAEAPA